MFSSFDPDVLLGGPWGREVPPQPERNNAALVLVEIIPRGGTYAEIPEVIRRAVNRGHPEAAIRWALWHHIKEGHLDARQGECMGIGEPTARGGMSFTMRPEVGGWVTARPEFRLWLDDLTLGDQEGKAPKPPPSQRRGGKPTVDQRLRALWEKQPNTVLLSAEKLAVILGCGKATVIESSTWKTSAKVRQTALEMRRLELAEVKQRRNQGMRPTDQGT